MERKLDRNRRLADYIYDDLGPEEIVEIEEEISKDHQLSESYRLNMLVKDYLQAKVQLEDMRLDPQMEDAEKLADMAFKLESHNEHSRGSNPIGFKRKRIRNIAMVAALAASVTILISVGILPGRSDQDRLFYHYYEPDEASNNAQRGQRTELYRDVAEGITQYLEGNYAQSIRLFNDLASNPVIKPEVDYYTGLSYLGLGQFQDAQNNLEMIVYGNARYLPEAMWYLSLCFLKMNKIKNATVLLMELESYDGMYKDDAQTLLKKLRRFK